MVEIDRCFQSLNDGNIHTKLAEKLMQVERTTLLDGLLLRYMEAQMHLFDCCGKDNALMDL